MLKKIFSPKKEEKKRLYYLYIKDIGSIKLFSNGTYEIENWKGVKVKPSGKLIECLLSSPKIKKFSKCPENR